MTAGRDRPIPLDNRGGYAGPCGPLNSRRQGQIVAAISGNRTRRPLWLIPTGGGAVHVDSGEGHVGLYRSPKQQEVGQVHPTGQPGKDIPAPTRQQDVMNPVTSLPEFRTRSTHSSARQPSALSRQGLATLLHLVHRQRQGLSTGTGTDPSLRTRHRPSTTGTPQSALERDPSPSVSHDRVVSPVRTSRGSLSPSAAAHDFHSLLVLGLAALVFSFLARSEVETVSFESEDIGSSWSLVLRPSRIVCTCKHAQRAV